MVRCDLSPRTASPAQGRVTPLTGAVRRGRYYVHLRYSHCEAPLMVQRNGGARTASRPSAKPKIGQRGKEIQEFGTIARLPIGLDESVCRSSAEALNQTLADGVRLLI